MYVLDNKIPPPIIFLIVAIVMWATARASPTIDLSQTLRLTLAILFGGFGLVMTVLSLKAFREAQTTVNPVKIETASSLVTTGVFGYTRNPMYVSLTSFLIGWAIYLAAPLTLLGPLAFVAYITRFQIIPEERALRRIFGKSYDDYCVRVRRWL
jgi:protein-S-isoprenylcysteine O-methyltransferase Ste14